MTFSVRDLIDEPDDARAACALAEAFLVDWVPEVALGADDADEALPTALRWVYRRLGPSGRRLFQQDPLVRADSLRADVDGMVVFRTEQQGCVEWGFPVDAGDDPPVLVREPWAGGASWTAFQDRLSIHLLEGVLSEAALVGAYAANLEATSESLFCLERVPLLGIPTHAMWTDLRGGVTVSWRGRPEAIIRNDGDTWLWALARTADDLHALTDAVPGDWAVAG